MGTASNINGEPLRGAIVGFGNAAIHAHLPAWRTSEQFAIAAVVEPHPERAAAARQVLPDARICAGIDELLALGGLDFVDICTPPCYHVDLVAAACRAGLHVFCEKPLAASLENVQEIQRVAGEYRRVVFTVNNWKYAPLWLKTRELLEDGAIGPIRSLSLNVLRPPNSGGGATDWRKCLEIAGGGILVDHGWHNLYVMLSLMREPPLLVSAKMESPGEAGACCEETVDLAVHFNRAEARLHLTWRASCRRNFGSIVGETGTILINDDHLIVERRHEVPVRYDFAEPLSASSHHPEWMTPVIDDFHGEISNEHKRGANLAEARWCAQLIELAYRSSRQAARPVEVLRSGPGAFTLCA